MSGNKIVRTPIVYYGGKTSMISYIRPWVPVHECYTETFFGGGTVFFDKDPVKNETINDRLDVCINFYRTLKLNYTPLKRLIDATLIGRTIHHEALSFIKKYQRSQRTLNELTARHRVTLAWAFWVCTNFAYSNKIGGGYKYSNDMSVAVPDTLKKRKEDFTEQLSERLAHAYIENDDALKILESRNTAKAFHYIDPPYPNADQGHYSGYGWDQYENLLIWLANECRGKFMLSSYNSDMLEGYVKIYEWHKREITHKVGGLKSHHPAKNRTDRTEVLITNYDSPCGTLNLFDKH